jgi:DMSO reductase family type II enzyme chaperone
METLTSQPAGNAHTLSEEIYEALARSILYEALAIGFRAPTASAFARLAHSTGRTALLDAADEVGGQPLAACAAAVIAGEAEGYERLATRHRRLFGHTARGKVSPYETEYGEKDLFQQPQDLADLSGFLQAFGLELRRDAHERVDHVSCECEFLSFLARKEAHASEVQDPEMHAETLRAERFFLRDHLARFTPAFAHGLEREDRGAFYCALGALLLAFVSSECSRLQVNLGTAGLRLRIEIEDRLPMACGESDRAACDG